MPEDVAAGLLIAGRDEGFHLGGLDTPGAGRTENDSAQLTAVQKGVYLRGFEAKEVGGLGHREEAGHRSGGMIVHHSII